jgi:hypothetical protein
MLSGPAAVVFRGSALTIAVASISGSGGAPSGPANPNGGVGRLASQAKGFKRTRTNVILTVMP